MKRIPVVTLAVAVSACLVYALPWREELAYEVGDGRLWQLFTCHLVHWSGKHLVWDVCGFLILGWISERSHRVAYLCFLAVGAISVPLLACTMTPDITHYGGLSGLVLGQVALWLTLSLVRSVRGRSAGPSLAAAVLLALLFVKQGYELLHGDTSLVTMNYETFATVPAAHLISVVIGVLVALTLPGGGEREGAPSRRTTGAYRQTID